MTFSDRSMCMIPYQGIGLPLFSLFLIRLFGGAQGKGWRGSMLVLHILQSQKTGSNRENRSYNQIKMCMCVEFFWIKLAPFSAWLYLLFWDMGYLSFPFSFSFSHASGHIYFFFFFRIAHIPFAICRIMLKRWSILVWMAGMFLRNF